MVYMIVIIKKRIRMQLIGLLGFFAFIPSVAFSVPKTIAVQGQVSTKSSSLPVAEIVSVTFSLYDSMNGVTALWVKSRDVEIVNGIFNVRLGEDEPLPATFFDGDTLYLGIKFGFDHELQPRYRLTSEMFVHKTRDYE